MSRGRREWVAAACVLLGLSACATGGGGRGSGSPFPSRAEIDALTHGTGAISPFEQAVVDADAWTFGEPLVEVLETSDYVDPSPWGKSLSEQVAADPARLRGTSAMHCAAREHARFYLQYAAVPAISLRQAMMEHCGSVSVDAIPLYLYGPVETEHTDAALHRAWAPSVARMVRESTRSGRRELGIAFARDEKKAVVVLLSGERKVELERVSRVVGATGAKLVLRGTVLVPADRVSGLINQGRYGFAACVPEPGVSIPRFALTCELAAGDAGGRAQLVGHRRERFFGEGLLQAEALRDAQTRPYRSVRYTSEAMVASAADLPPRLLALTNEVRRQAGAEPVTLSAAQSATSEKLAPRYFEAVTSPGKGAEVDLIVLGLMAGWDVGAAIRGSSFTSAAIGPTRDASEWVSAVMSSPGGRSALLQKDVRVVAFGPVMVDSPAVIGATFTGYGLFQASDDAAMKEAVIEKIRAERAELGLPAPVIVTTLDADASALASEVQAGAASPTDALGELLQTGSNVLGRSVRGVAYELGDAEQMQLPDEMLRAKQLEISLTVTHYQPEGSPWGRFVVLILVPGSGTRA